MNADQPQTLDDLKTVSLGRRDRALKIWEMFEGGAKIRQIAEVFHISPRMVYRDLKVAKRLNKEMVQSADQGELLGGEIAFWRLVARQAMQEYALAKSENGKIGFLRAAMEARAKLNKLFLDSGLIEKVAEKVNLGLIPPFEDPEVRQVALIFIKLCHEKGE